MSPSQVGVISQELVISKTQITRTFVMFYTLN